MVTIKFEEYKIDILIVDEAGVNHLLDLQPLYEKIEVDKSSWKISEKRITIILKKWIDTKWFKLMKGGVIQQGEPAYATTSDGKVLQM